MLSILLIIALNLLNRGMMVLKVSSPFQKLPLRILLIKYRVIIRLPPKRPLPRRIDRFLGRLLLRTDSKRRLPLYFFQLPNILPAPLDSSRLYLKMVPGRKHKRLLNLVGLSYLIFLSLRPLLRIKPLSTL